MQTREIGTVKWFNDRKGYGFIIRKTGEDVFVHYRAIQAEGFRSLAENAQVEFTIAKDARGLHAERVTIVA